MEQFKRVVVEYNDLMTGTKRMDTFANCWVTRRNEFTEIDDDKAKTYYRTDTIIKITCEKYSREEKKRVIWVTT